MDNITNWGSNLDPTLKEAEAAAWLPTPEEQGKLDKFSERMDRMVERAARRGKDPDKRRDQARRIVDYLGLGEDAIERVKGNLILMIDVPRHDPDARPPASNPGAQRAWDQTHAVFVKHRPDEIAASSKHRKALIEMLADPTRLA